MFVYGGCNFHFVPRTDNRSTRRSATCVGLLVMQQAIYIASPLLTRLQPKLEKLMSFCFVMPTVCLSTSIRSKSAEWSFMAYDACGYYIYHLLSYTKTMKSARRMYSCFSHDSCNKQQLFLHRALTG